ncbi:MAG TPA: hypothetical protein PK926_10085 [Spirochaetota bacterium]|nr:hypothetical protein [Spirochaetota bacterium]HPI88696.1 hypothetical protein [Spirochaetota bacterium]HPR48782.1 hypothetical protein [Spirochaetota bacterium]
MADNLESAVNSLSEQTKKLEIASYYTHGDMDKAKKMISGAFKDIYAIKMRFSSSIYGAALLFYNPTYSILYPPYLIVTPSFAVDDMRTTVSWRQFEQEITENLEKKEHDDVLVAHMRDELAMGLSLEFAAELKRLIESNDEIAINRHFMKLIQNRLGFQKLNITVDFESATSLEMELDSKSSKKLDPRELKKKEEEKSKSDEKGEGEETEEDPLAGKEIKLILQGSLILSPIKGKDIKELSVGERIMISIIDSNPKGIDVAKAFNAYDDEQQRIKPIPGRIISLRHLSTGGYKIFAIVAKGIYLKIVEEEESIKVAVEHDTRGVGTPVKGESSTRAMLPLIITLVIVLFLLISLIVYFVIG